MPSSVIIVALAAAWLVVLVPMVARRRQQVARTDGTALAARVVHSGGERAESREEAVMPDHPGPSVDEDLAELEAELDEDLEEDIEEPPPLPQPSGNRRAMPERVGYRPGRGGFDPEAAEIAARAKYSFRQRVVVILLITVVATAALAAFLLPVVWWGNGAADVVLVGYLGYLRRQVRIEEEIRQRRLARYQTRAPRRPAPRQETEDEDLPDAEDIQVVEPVRRPVVERRPSPTSRVRRNAVVVDLDDEDPAFHELDEPGVGPYRRAAGE